MADHIAEQPPALAIEAMPQSRVATMLSFPGLASLLVVDVRNSEDYTGGCIRGSLHVPASGFDLNRQILYGTTHLKRCIADELTSRYELVYKSDYQWVVFADADAVTDSAAASRCAGSFLDYTRRIAADEHMQVHVLEGGLRGWVAAGQRYQALMSGFRSESWPAAA